MKKIIALITAAFLILSFFASSFVVNAAENESDKMTKQEYLAAQEWLIGRWCDRKITYEEYKQQSEAVTNEFYSDNTVGDTVMSWASNIGNTVNAVGNKINATVEQYGDAAVDVIKSAISGLMSEYKTSTQVSTTDMHGYGAMVEIHRGNYVLKWWAEYITYYSEQNCALHGTGASASGNVGEIDSKSPSRRNVNGKDFYTISGDSSLGAITDVKYYGDIRYGDGTQAPTDDEFATMTDYDFTQKTDPENPDNKIPTTEQELTQLLEDINEELERLNPDLSNTDEILKSIYYRLGKLDSDDDGEKLDTINETILSVLQGGEKNEKAIDVLLDMREYLKNGMNGASDDEHEISGTLYNVKPLDKNWLNKLTTDKTELKVEYEGKTYYLESDGCLKLGDKYYHVDLNYDSYTDIDFDFNNENVYIDESKYVDVDFKDYNAMWANLSDTQKKKLNDITELIAKLLEQGIPYSAVTGGLTFYQDIIFNSHDPKDIVFNLEFGGQEYSFTILSTSFFGEQGAQALQIVKNFVAIVTCYVWLLSMRRKTSSMMR